MHIAYDAATEGEATDSVVVDTSSPVTTGFESPSSCFGTTDSAGASLAAAGTVLCGGASSVASLAAAVSRPAVAPPLVPPRARVLPRPLGFGGIAVVK
jgi:hypothetical protein